MPGSVIPPHPGAEPQSVTRTLREYPANGDASVSSASQVTAPPPGIAVAPNVQVAPAGTVGAEVGGAETPGQRFPGAGAAGKGRLLPCPSFWPASNVQAEGWYRVSPR